MDEPADEQWPSGGPNEPATELLSGAIARVEGLIKRLEYPAQRIAHGDGATIGPPPRGATDGGGKTRADGGTERPGRLAAPDARAEALRITLHAHDEANQLLGEAAQLRAQAAAEGQRILAEAQRLAEELRLEAEAEADRFLEKAAEAAEAMRAEAERSMRAAITDATTAADHVRTATKAEAQRLRDEAGAWAAAERAAAESDAARLRAAAARDAAAIREGAAAAGREEAQRRVAVEVEAAVSRARARAEASEGRAQRTLSGTVTQAGVASEQILALVAAASTALAALENVAAELDGLRNPADAPADAAKAGAEEGLADVRPAEQAAPDGQPTEDERAAAGAADLPGEQPERDELEHAAAGQERGAKASGGRPRGALFRGEKR